MQFLPYAIFGEPYHLQETIYANQIWCIKSPYNALLHPTKTHLNPIIRAKLWAFKEKMSHNAKCRIDLDVAEYDIQICLAFSSSTAYVIGASRACASTNQVRCIHFIVLPGSFSLFTTHHIRFGFP